MKGFELAFAKSQLEGFPRSSLSIAGMHSREVSDMVNRNGYFNSCWAELEARRINDVVGMN